MKTSQPIGRVELTKEEEPEQEVVPLERKWELFGTNLRKIKEWYKAIENFRDFGNDYTVVEIAVDSSVLAWESADQGKEWISPSDKKKEKKG